MPPEVFCDSTIENDDHVETDIVTEPCGPKTDIWSLGLILLEVFTVSVCKIYMLHKRWNLVEIMRF